MKTLDEYFADWENGTFGFCYGSGEEHIVPCVKKFMECCKVNSGGNCVYDYRALEEALTPSVAWLLINILCRADAIEYGTSPRFGWLTEGGRRLKEFMDGKSAEELAALTERDNDYIHCEPQSCNCGPGGYEKDRVCPSPFWGS